MNAAPLDHGPVRPGPVRDPAKDRRQRRLLVGLAVLFFAPLAAAFLLYYGSGVRPGRHVNHGDLIDPARPLPVLSLPLARPTPGAGTVRLDGKWTLLYVGAGGCTARCRTELYESRQVRIALNRDMDRVQRVFVATGDCCDWSFLAAEHPDLSVVADSAAAAPLLEQLPAVRGVPPTTADRVYFIDPLGNLMMSYAPDAPPKGMLQDLKRLLGLSHVG
jgi:hypothetical protein